MRTPILERLVGGLVWQAARVNRFNPDAGHNELATAAMAATSGDRLALVSLGQGDFTRNLIHTRTHRAGQRRRH